MERNVLSPGTTWTHWENPPLTENPSDYKAHRPEQTYRLVFQSADLLSL